MFTRKQKGFTLIELLVVIAIIGLLAGIVLVSLSGARNQARDSRIIAALTQVRTVAELISTNNSGSYEPATAAGNLCGSDATLNQANSPYGSDMTTIASDIQTQNGTAVATCNADANDYCAYATLATSGRYYCIDSTLRAIQTGTNPSGVGLCTATTFICPTS